MEYESIKYEAKDKSLDIRFSKEENTIWMNQSDMVLLFNKGKASISKTIKKSLEKYSEYRSVVAKMETTGVDGKTYNTDYYNLDIIKHVGYKIDPQLTEKFVSWRNEELNRLNNQIIPIESKLIRFDNGEVLLDMTIEPVEDTVYLDKDQLVLLFDTTRQNLEYHISNIYESGELEHTPTCKKVLQVQF